MPCGLKKLSNPSGLLFRSFAAFSCSKNILLLRTALQNPLIKISTFSLQYAPAKWWKKSNGLCRKCLFFLCLSIQDDFKREKEAKKEKEKR